MELGNLNDALCSPHAGAGENGHVVFPDSPKGWERKPSARTRHAVLKVNAMDSDLRMQIAHHHSQQ